jgi:hypothetical protein
MSKFVFLTVYIQLEAGFLHQIGITINVTHVLTAFESGSKNMNPNFPIEIVKTAVSDSLSR